VHFGEKRRERARAPQPLRKNRLDAEGLRACRKWGHNSGRGFDAREETFEAAQSFVDTFDGRRVREAQIARRAETFSSKSR